MSEELIYNNEVSQAIESVCATIAYDRCYVLCDVNSREEVLPLLTAPVIADAKVITVPAGESVAAGVQVVSNSAAPDAGAGASSNGGGFEVGRWNNFSAGISASMPLVIALSSSTTLI